VRTNGVKQDRDDSETLGGVMLIRVAPNGYIGLEPPARREPLTAERLERFGCDDWVGEEGEMQQRWQCLLEHRQGTMLARVQT
jgi:hypothetical protein